jgi:hypothetical protein
MQVNNTGDDSARIPAKLRGRKRATLRHPSLEFPRYLASEKGHCLSQGLSQVLMSLNIMEMLKYDMQSMAQKQSAIFRLSSEQTI